MTRDRRRHLAIATLLAGLYIALLLHTAGAQGYARDEGFYFAAAESYGRWLTLLAHEPMRALTRGAIDASFGVNHEHPPFAKLLFALSFLVQKSTHVFADDGTSFRFPGMAFAGLTVAIVYRWAAELRGVLAGVAAAVLFAFVPTTFYHAHLDCFDVPITAMCLATTYLYWQQERRGGVGPAFATAIVFGLTLATKHNSWLLPPALGLHALGSRWPQLRQKKLAIPLSLPLMIVLGPLVAIASWPWVWFDPGRRLADYARFHLQHEYYNIEFLGVTWFRPPFPHGYAPLMTLATVPTVSLLAALVGFVIVVAKERLPSKTASAALLFVLAIGVSYGPWVSSGTPIFGGTKHWLPAYPYLALFGGLGVAWAADSVARRLDRSRQSLGKMAFTSLALAAPIVETWHAAPWGLGGYVPLVGGAPGAATLGLNRSFWGYTTGSVVDVLNEKTPPNGSVYIHDTAWDAFRMLQRDGKLRPDIRPIGNPARADVALFHYEPHMEGVEYQLWVAFGTSTPVAVRGLDDVPTVWVYARK